MSKIKIEKDIYVRDKYGVKRHAFMAGHEVEQDFYDQVLNTDTVVNPDDLPKAPSKDKSNRSVHSQPLETQADERQVEVSTSDEGAEVDRQRVDEAVGADLAVEATAKVAEGEPTPADSPAPADSESKPEDGKSDNGGSQGDEQKAEEAKDEAEKEEDSPKPRKSKKGK